MVSDSFQYGTYQVVHTLLVIYHRYSCNAVCNNHATGHGFMSKQFGQAGYGTAFHFKIRDMQSLLDIGFDFFILQRIGQWYAQLSALRAVESTA